MFVRRSRTHRKFVLHTSGRHPRRLEVEREGAMIGDFGV
jgi:hypothetical protein